MVIQIRVESHTVGDLFKVSEVFFNCFLFVGLFFPFSQTGNVHRGNPQDVIRLTITKKVSLTMFNEVCCSW